MTLGHWLDCKHAPAEKHAKHCSKFNEGDISNNKAAARGKLNKEKTGATSRPVGKGYFGCTNRCRFFEPRGVKQGNAN